MTSQKNPKIIHRIFFDDLPPFFDPFDNFLKTWQHALPDYEIMTWNGSNLNVHDNPWVSLSHGKSNRALMQSYFRWKILHEYGGIILDPECEIINGQVLNNIVEDLYSQDHYDVFFGIADRERGKLSTHVVGAKRGSDLLTYMRDLGDSALAEFWPYREAHCFSEEQLICRYLGVREATLAHLDMPVIIGGCKIYSAEYFSPGFDLRGAVNYEENKTCVYPIIGGADYYLLKFNTEELAHKGIVSFSTCLEIISERNATPHYFDAFYLDTAIGHVTIDGMVAENASGLLLSGPHAKLLSGFYTAKIACLTIPTSGLLTLTLEDSRGIIASHIIDFSKKVEKEILIPFFYEGDDNQFIHFSVAVYKIDKIAVKYFQIDKNSTLYLEKDKNFDALEAGDNPKITALVEQPKSTSMVGLKAIGKQNADKPVPLSQRLNKLFIATTLLPTILAVVYYGFIASDVYVSESRFIVQSTGQQTSSALGLLLKGVGMSRSGEDAYSVQQYILSRDALHEIDRSLPLRSVFKGNKYDYFNQFPGLLGDDSFEELYKRYDSHVTVEIDSATSVGVLTTRAFNADDSQRINELLLQKGEALVNKLNNRARQDSILVSTKEVLEAVEKDKTAALELARFRNAENVIDPEKQSAIPLQAVAKLNEALLATKTQLLQLQMSASNNPQIPSLKMRVQALEQAITRESQQVTGGITSLAGKSADYARLVLEKEFTGKMLASAMTSLEQARNEAQHQQLYLERVAEPSRPDKATEPRRVRGIAAVFAIGLILWGVLSMLVAGVREHQD